MEQADHPHIVQKAFPLYLSDSRQLPERIQEAIHIADAMALHAGVQQVKTVSGQVGVLTSFFQPGAIARRADQQRLDKAANLLAPPEESIEPAC